MEIGKRRRKNQAPLIVEDHPADYTGYPFITLIQYRESNILTIVDNTNKKNVTAFVLDLCGPEYVDEEQLITVAIDWYKDFGDDYPLSFQFSKMGISNEMTKIFRTFNIDFISRIIGPLPRFEMDVVARTKKRRRKP